jgi:hypothetical protein
MSRYLIAFLLLFIINPVLQAQQQQAWSGFGIESNVMVGKMIRHIA